MKPKILFFFLIFLILESCATQSEHTQWYERLRRDEGSWVSDSVMWQVAYDGENVLETEKRLRATAQAAATELLGWRLKDSLDAIGTIYNDTATLTLDSVTLAARNGNQEAQRELNIRHTREGDINGLWTTDSLVARDQRIRIEVQHLEAWQKAMRFNWH
jgi:hypothetical protein